ncbi:hypothetical protein C2G38_2165747 [Gigaspora rosea]|uniref:Uncharacterized protein n=1 Tax=Gigaspora rosea TaxID=44941 RepID=A0A397VSH2_9GLOM|nr:hypothetical protein C2G38_2165747 [Gigaspora rosea]
MNPLQDTRMCINTILNDTTMCINNASNTVGTEFYKINKDFKLFTYSDKESEQQASNLLGLEYQPNNLFEIEELEHEIDNSPEIEELEH